MPTTEPTYPRAGAVVISESGKIILRVTDWPANSDLFSATVLKNDLYSNLHQPGDTSGAWIQEAYSIAPPEIAAAFSGQIPAKLDSYDWAEAFAYAATPEVVINAPEGFSREGIKREDVAEILHMVEGENDGDSWIIAGKLADGRFFFLDAWCDYTGWDCRANGSATVAHDLPSLYRLALNDGARERFKIDCDGNPCTTPTLNDAQ